MSEFAKLFQAPTSGKVEWAKFHPALDAAEVHLDGMDGSVTVPIAKVEGLAAPLAAVLEALRVYVEQSAGVPIAVAAPVKAEVAEVGASELVEAGTTEAAKSE